MRRLIIDGAKVTREVPDGVIVPDMVRPSWCFSNAKKISEANPGVAYMEGYLMSHHDSIGMIEHAWNAVGRKMFDVTAKLANNEAV